MTSDRLTELRLLRDQLKTRIAADDCCVCERPSVSQLAPLAGQLTRVLEQIDVIEKAQPRGSKVDELKNRRETRRANSPRRSAPPGSGGDVGTGSS